MSPSSAPEPPPPAHPWCPQAPARPLFQAALALALGTATGWCVAGGGPDPWVFGSGAALLAWAARKAARGSLSPRLVFLLALVAGGRAALIRPGPGEERPLDGRWIPDPSGSSSQGETERGRTRAGGGLWQCLRGSVAKGERVRILDRGFSVRAAAGPGEQARVLRVELRPDEWARVAPAPGGSEGILAPRIAALRRRVRERLEALEQTLEPDDPARGLLPALLVGESQGLSRATADLFTRTGTRHLLALSGLHVGLMAWLFAWPLGRWLALALGRLGELRPGRTERGRPHWTARVGPEPIRALLVLLLVPLGGGGPAITRAGVALALVALAPRMPGVSSSAATESTGGVHMGRRVDGLSLWGLALCLELTLSPQGVARAGLELSYLATLGLLLGLGTLRRGRPPRLAPTDSLGRARSPWWRVPLQRVLDLGWAAAVTSALAMTVTLPVVWERFGECSPVGILATPLALPALVALLAGGWIHVLLPGALPPEVVCLPARGLVFLLERLDSLPLTPFVLPLRPWLWVALAVAGTLALWMGTRRRFAGPLLCLTWGVLLMPRPAATGSTPELVLLDVGHGTAALLRTPEDGVWLFDAGSRDRVGVASAVGAMLRRWEARSLSVVLSHRDRDHAGALPWILERWAPVLGAGALTGIAGWGEGRLPLDLERGRVRLPTAGSLELFLLRGAEGRGNEGSRSLEIRVGSWRALLTGDAEQDGLAGLLEPGILEGPYDLVLLPHHGSESPHLDEFLERCRPGLVWISCGAPAVLGDELDRWGLPWASTYRQGALVARPEGPNAPFPGDWQVLEGY